MYLSILRYTNRTHIKRQQDIASLHWRTCSYAGLLRGGIALERIFFFGRSERPQNIGTDQFFLGSFSGRI